MALPSMVRSFMSSTAAASAVPAVATRSGGGLAAMFGFGTSRIDVPLSEALPAVPKPLKGSLPASNKLQTSQLDSGATLAAAETGSPLTTVAVVAPGGSAYETDETTGASKVLEQLAFKSTTSRSTFRLTRELEKIGATAYSRAGRDSLLFAVDTVKLHTAEATEILLDAVLNARITYWEFKEVLEVVQEQLRRSNPASTVTEVLHRAAYDGGLGRPLLPDAEAVGGLTVEAVREFARSLLQPSQLLVAGVGVGHDELKGLANPLVPKAGGGGTNAAASAYVGGAFNVLTNSPLTHVGLAFEAKGGLSDPKAQAVAAVAKVLLDDARAPLPWTRREDNVLRSVGAFAHLYRHSGLVGVVASAAPQQAGALIDAVCKRVESVAKGVSDVQLKQAKAVAIGSFKASTATTSGALSVLGPALLANKSFSSADFTATVEGLTSAEVAGFVQKVVKSQPTFVTYGSLANLPRYDSIAKRFA